MINASFLHDPYPTYQALRAAGPVHWSTEFCGGAWLLTNYADVAQALQDPRLSVRRAGGWVNSSGENASNELRELKQIFSRSVLFMNPPAHNRVRHSMAAGFRRESLQPLTERIRQIVDRLLDKAVLQREFDFMGQFARPLPALVMADMLAIDPADQPRFIAWSDNIAAFIGSPTPSLDLAHRAQAGLVALNEYFQVLLPQRRLCLGDDLISQMIRSESVGTIITTKELLAQCCTLLFAGHETTRNLLGNGMFYFLKDAAYWQRILQQPTLLRGALKEVLRFDSPVQYTGRILTSDIEMHGTMLRKGDLVVPLIGAANRDPAKFTDPDRLDITRDEGNHLSFGYGPHVCIGATLTYMEADIAFTRLMQRLPHLTLVSTTPQWSGNAVYRGLTELRLRTHQEKAPALAYAIGKSGDRHV
jgi:cytochrome P450